MPFISTSSPGQSPVSLTYALSHSLAPDGGLYLPARLEPLPEDWLRSLRKRSRGEIASRVLGHLLQDDLDPHTVGRLAEEALDFPLPVRRIDDRLCLLELFHGPTLAFKDVGARFLARLMAHLQTELVDEGAAQQGEAPLTVLVATSGDTGGAVAHAFWGVAGTRVAILYPQGQVSPGQERQMATLGGNVRAIAVQGSFDDCQALAKRAFADRELTAAVRLSSANSISIGRLLPQVVYYFCAVAELGAEAARPLLFVTPSGNFGNLTAGLIAHRLGLPAAGFVAATNANDVVPVYLRTGNFQPRPSLRTLSNAMDVGNPSNLVRVLHLYDNELAALRADLRASRHSDADTVAAIAEVYREHGVLLDPHSAVGYLAARQALAPSATPSLPAETLAVVLATAHPGKFPEVVEPAIGESVPLPASLQRHLAQPLQAEAMDADYGQLKQRLIAW